MLVLHEIFCEYWMKWTMSLYLCSNSFYTGFVRCQQSDDVHIANYSTHSHTHHTCNTHAVVLIEELNGGQRKMNGSTKSYISNVAHLHARYFPFFCSVSFRLYFLLILCRLDTKHWWNLFQSTRTQIILCRGLYTIRSYSIRYDTCISLLTVWLYACVWKWISSRSNFCVCDSNDDDDDVDERQQQRGRTFLGKCNEQTFTICNALTSLNKSTTTNDENLI